MTLPEEITTGVVTWDISSLLGDGAGALTLGDLSTGSIAFVASAPLLLDAGVAKTMLVPAPVGPYSLALGRQELAFTHLSDVSPQDWTWTCHITLPGGLVIAPFSFTLTADDLDDHGEVALVSLAQVPDSGGVPITRGPQGNPGSDNLSMADNGDGTATFSWTGEDDTEHSTDVATTTDGKLDPGVLPSLAIVDVYTVSSQADMLALAAQKGDIAVRSDNGRKYILADTDPTVLANWVELAGPDPIASTDISDATTAGRALLTAADAAAQRTTLGLGTSATVDTGTTSGTLPLLNGSGRLDMARMASGTPNGSQFVRDDGTLAVPPATLTSKSGTLAADVNLTTSAATLFTISGLGAGTWQISVVVSILSGISAPRTAAIEAVAGTGTPTLSGVTASELNIGVNSSGNEGVCALTFLAVCTTSSTITVQAAASNSNLTAKATSATFSGVPVSGYTAIKIA